MTKGWERSPSIDQAIYFLDNEDDRRFISYVNGISNPPNSFNGIIPSGQAFWIKSSGPASISINENAKTSAEPSKQFFDQIQMEEESTKEILDIFLTSDIKNIDCATTIYIDDKATSKFDPLYDAYLFDEFKEKNRLGSLTEDGTQVVINAISSKDSYTSGNIPLHLEIEEKGDYKFKFNLTRKNPNFSTALLIDTKTEDSIAIIDGANYKFHIEDEEDASASEKRFKINLNFPQDNEIIPGLAGSYKLYPNPANEFIVIEGGENTFMDFELKLISSLGQEIVNTQHFGRGMCKLQLPALTDGVYFIQINFQGNVVNKRFMVDQK